MKIEQLYYSWAARGLEGRNRLQIVAASPGLANRDFSLCRAALRLCQYTFRQQDLAGGPPPVSYGWVDDGATRFWFRRQDAGLGGDGRPGNFTAHILTGPPRSLPTSELLCRFASPFWESTARRLDETQHNGLDPSLPLVSIDDIPPSDRSGPPSHDELGMLLEILLSAGPQPRIAFALEPAEIVNLLRVVTGSLRQLLERAAFSTYESERTRRQFNLVGVGRHGRADLGFQSLSRSSTVSVSSKAKSIARLMLSSNDEEGRVLAAAVGASTIPQGGLDLERFAGLAKRVDDLGRQPNNMNRLRAALSSRSVFRTALNYGSVRKAVTQAIVESNDDVKDALRLAARDLPEDLLRELGANTAEVLIERSKLQELDRLMDQLSFISPAMEDGLLDNILRRLGDSALETGGPSALSAKALRELLRYAGRTPTGAPEAIKSVVAHGAQYYHQLVPDYVLPIEWRARILADAFIGHGARVSDVAALVGQEPRLLSAVSASGDEESIFAKALKSQPMRSVVEMTSALALELSLPLRLSLVCSVGKLLTLKDRLAFLAATGPLCGEAVEDLSWTNIVESTIHEAVKQALTHPGDDPMLLMMDIDQLSTLSSNPQVRNFRMLVQLACWAYQGSEQRARVSAAAFDRFSDLTSASLAARLGFDCAVGEATSMSQVSSVVHILGDRVGSDHAVQVAAILRSALRHAALYENGERCAVASLSYIATSYVDAMALAANGELESADLQGMAARLARLITDRGWTEATGQTAQGCDSSVGWWSTLEEARTNRDAQP